MKILLIRFSSIGDILMTTPIIRALKTQKNAEIHFLTKKSYCDVLQGNPNIDTLHLLDDSLEKTIQDLKKIEFDLVIDLHKNLRSMRVRHSLKSKHIVINKYPLRKWLFLIFGIDWLIKNHVIEQWFDKLSLIGIHNDQLGMDYHIRTKGLLREKTTNPSRIALVVGGTYPTKRIPAQLCNQIIDMAAPYEFYILGGRDVNPEPFRRTERAHNLVGQLSIDESAAYLEACDMVITGDTGLAHIAATLDKPVIQVWGSTSPKFGLYPYFGKRQRGRITSISNESLECWPCSKYGKDKCPKGHMACLAKISANGVILAMNEYLSCNH